MSDTEYDPFGNSSLSFHVGADILNCCYYISFLCFSMCNKY